MFIPGVLQICKRRENALLTPCTNALVLSYGTGHTTAACRLQAACMQPACSRSVTVVLEVEYDAR
jgi:hypothetical protein